MKKLLLVLFAALFAASVNAQLVVDDSGNVAVGYDGTSAIASDFAVNSIGNNYSTMHVQSNKSNGLHVSQLSSNSTQYGIYSFVTNNNNKSFGLYGRCTSTTSYSNGAAIGVCGSAERSKSGFNYGVVGALTSTSYGAGVFGTSIISSPGTDLLDYVSNTGARYAGYFKGNVYVTGTVNGMTISSSDYRLKEKIEALPSNTLDDICKINVVKFNYKQREVENANGKKIGLYEEDSPILTHKHYGVIAQELQKIYPDLVIEGEDGYLSVNYVELVPLLIQSIQELSAKLDEAQKSNARRDDGTTDIADAENVLKTELFQNTPNPFTEVTTIACTIAENVKTAVLYVYDLNGKQIAEYPVAGHGETSVTIEGSSLGAGMYLYSLIADGKVIDTKRMILTK